jgi:hypothetical protein
LLYDTISSSEYSSSSEELSSSSSATLNLCMSGVLPTSLQASQHPSCQHTPPAQEIKMNPTPAPTTATNDSTRWLLLHSLLTSLTTNITNLVNYVGGQEQVLTDAATSLQDSAVANQAAAEALGAKADPKPKTKAKRPDPYHGEPAKAVAFIHFQWGDDQGDSIKILRTITMGTKMCEKFTTLFCTHETQSKLGEVALIEEYKCRLNQSLQAKIFNLNPMPTDLKGWQDKACQLDKQHQQEKHYQDLYSPAAPKPKVVTQPAKPAFVPRPTFTPIPVAANPFVLRQDPNAMDVDRARMMANGLCFYCKEKGHTKFTCPLLKNKKPSYTTCTVDVAGMSSEEHSVLFRQLQDFQEDQQA